MSKMQFMHLILLTMKLAHLLKEQKYQTQTSKSSLPITTLILWMELGFSYLWLLKARLLLFLTEELTGKVYKIKCIKKINKWTSDHYFKSLYLSFHFFDNSLQINVTICLKSNLNIQFKNLPQTKLA